MRNIKIKTYTQRFNDELTMKKEVNKLLKNLKEIEPDRVYSYDNYYNEEESVFICSIYNATKTNNYELTNENGEIEIVKSNGDLNELSFEIELENMLAPLINKLQIIKITDIGSRECVDFIFSN